MIKKTQLFFPHQLQRKILQKNQDDMHKNYPPLNIFLFTVDFKDHLLISF